MSTSHSVLRTKPVEDVLAQGSDAGQEGPHGHHRLTRRLGAKDLMAKEGVGAGIVGHRDRDRRGPQMELGRIRRERRLQQL